MKVFVDGDGCPVVRLCETICKKQNVPFVVYCDTAHAIRLQYGQVVVVDSGADMAALSRTVDMLMGGGRSVRVQKEPDTKLRYKEKFHFGEGGLEIRG